MKDLYIVAASDKSLIRESFSSGVNIEYIGTSLISKDHCPNKVHHYREYD